MKDLRFAIVIPCGPGAESIIDTISSIEHYCLEKHDIVIIDDKTTDGTYETVKKIKGNNLHLLRNKRKHGIIKLARSLSKAFKYVIDNIDCDIVLRLDQDALLTGHGILTDAHEFALSNSELGLYGVYDIDYNRPRSFSYHYNLINKETLWIRKLICYNPWWDNILRMAEKNGYKRGENVFGGAYFVTRKCLEGMDNIGALNIPYYWKSILQEDVYFSMATVAAGYKIKHFAVPTAPICLEWKGMPYPAKEILALKIKITHSVDKGRNTSREENEGYTAREFFKRMRLLEKNTTLKSMSFS